VSQYGCFYHRIYKIHNTGNRNGGVGASVSRNRAGTLADRPGFSDFPLFYGPVLQYKTVDLLHYENLSFLCFIQDVDFI